MRVHSDSYSAGTAHRFGARALTVGGHVLLGDTRAASSEAVLVHEVGHAVAQAQSGAQVVQLDAIDDVQNLLSYGVLDWAVTESEAMQALALLNALPDAALTAGMTRLGTKYVDRLLDNLPDAARSGPAYQRVVRVAGPVRTLATAVSDLNYGLFDWAVTDTDVVRVYNTFANLQPAQQETFLVGLHTANRLGRLIANSNAGHLSLYLHPWMNTMTRGRLTPNQLSVFRTIVRETDDLPTLTLAAGIRFDMTVGPTTIPAARPCRGSRVAPRDLPHARAAARGAHRAQRQPAVDHPVHGAMDQRHHHDGRLQRGPPRAHHQRHPSRRQAGHHPPRDRPLRRPADRLLHRPGARQAGAGGWVTHATHTDAAIGMINDAAAGSRPSRPEQADVVTDIETSMNSRTTAGLVARVKARPWFAPLPQATRDAVTADPTFDAVTVGLAQPWFKPNGGTALGLHMHQESYTPTWVRYDVAARARLLTAYQFRDEGEWFAEAYDFYYTPDSRGKGARLNDVDPNTKAWFDANVDPVAASR
ncbi:eCIS core domain-containing protein [Tessaracoccus coleopterorum]|uniref:eCIS core domain-containing protein n=1 Tax=Tessaracoccus coleopterorum TaxID=2714950 RepID=UPI002F9158A5